MSNIERICPDCGENMVSPEQYKIIGVCYDCERHLRALWARMDRDYHEQNGTYSH